VAGDVAQIPARREFKYLVDRARLPALRSALAAWCLRDKHAGPDGTYGLRSLYYDAPDMRLFKANEVENPLRFKARIRTYSDAPSAPVVAEVKFRDVDVIRKTRTVMPRGDWTAGLRPGAPLDPFTVRMHRHNLSPIVLVDYRREAYMSRVDEYARVSIDTAIRCQSMREHDLRGHDSLWRPIDHTERTFMHSSACVVELKWADAAPQWMMQLVQRMEFIRHSFSKYCFSVYSLAEDHMRDYRDAQSVWG